MTWFRREKEKLEPIENKRVRVPDDLWIKCDSCREIIFKKEVTGNLNVCPKCQFHFRLDAPARLALLFDNGEYEEIDRDLKPCDPLKFKDSKRYKDRLKKRTTGWAPRRAHHRDRDARLQAVVICAMEYRFMGGSMGSVVGEKITRGAELALARRHPFIIVSASGAPGCRKACSP